MELKEIEKIVTDFSTKVDWCLKDIRVCKKEMTQIKCTLEEKTTADGDLRSPKGFKCDNVCFDCKYGEEKTQYLMDFSPVEAMEMLNKPLDKMKTLLLYAMENGTEKLKYFWQDIQQNFSKIENQVIGDNDFVKNHTTFEDFSNWKEWERAKRWYLEIEKVIERPALKEAAPAETPKAAPAPVEKPLHFYCSFNTNTLTKIFEYLKNGRYFDADATLEAWLYICGVADLNSVFKPLNWISEAYLLGLLVKALFSKNKCWVITKNVFRVNGQEPTIDYLKTNCSKLNNNWKDGQKAEIFIKEIMAIK